MTQASLPTVAVVYATGSAGPAAVLRASRGVCEVVFVCDTANLGVAPLLAGIRGRARVCDISGLEPEAAVAALRVEQPSGIVTFSEHCLAQTAELAVGLGLPYHQPETVQLLTDKSAQRAALYSAGVDDTRSVVARSIAEVRSAADLLGYPVVVKPRTGAGSRDTLLLDTPGQCTGILTEIVRNGEGASDGEDIGKQVFVVEKCLLGEPLTAGSDWGDYVSVEAVVHRGEVRTVGVTGKLPLATPFRETGMFVPSTLSAAMESEVAELAAAAVRALGIRMGVTHTEVKLTPDGPRIIEVNGRTGGHVTELLPRAGAFDLVRAALEMSMGYEPAPVKPLPRDVTYEYFLIAPPSAGELLSLDGIEETEGIAGVASVDVLAAPGQRMDWRLGNQRVGSVHGTAPDHASLRSVIGEIQNTLRPQYAYRPSV